MGLNANTTRIAHITSQLMPETCLAPAPNVRTGADQCVTQRRLSIALIALAYNHARYLPQLFESILVNLDDIDELVLIDNGSSDETHNMMEEFGRRLPNRVRLTIHRNPPRHGVALAVNAGLRAATAEFVSVTSGDDFLLPNRFTAQLAALKADQNLAFCYSNGYVCDEQGVVSKTPLHFGHNGSLLRMSPDAIADALFYPVPALFTQCAIFRRDVLLDVGGWDEDLVIDDWPLNIKLFRKYGLRFRYVDAYVSAYRRHDSNASKRRFRQYMGQKRVLLKYAQGKELREGLFALLMAQVLVSVKRRQWHRVNVFVRSAHACRPAILFVFRWIANEARRRIFSKNKIR